MTEENSIPQGGNDKNPEPDSSKTFSFTDIDLGLGDPDPKTAVIAEEEVRKTAANIDKLIPTDILKWLQGESEQPEEIRKLGDDITSKLNWFIVFVVLSQYSRIPQMFKYLAKAEAALYTDKDFEGEINVTTIYEKYTKVTGELEKVLEFARKFTLQNRDILKGSGVSEDDRQLLDKIKRLKTEEVTQIIAILEKSDGEKNVK